MDKQQLQAYRNRLLDAGLPPRKVARHLRELQDHYQDLHGQALAGGADATLAQHRSRASMGSLDELAVAMIASTPRSLLHRHPLLLMLVVPLASWLLVSALLVFVLVLLFLAFSASSGLAPAVLPSWLAAFADTVVFLQSHVLTPLLAFVLITVSFRRHLKFHYWVPGVLALCLIGSFSSMGLTLPDAASDGQGSLYLSFGTTRRGAVVLQEYANLLRFAANVLLCAGWAWYQQAQQASGARISA